MGLGKVWKLLHTNVEYSKSLKMQVLLKSIEAFLRDQIWCDLERVYYFKTCGRVFSSLHPFLFFPYLRNNSVSPSVRRKLLMVRKLCSLSLPDSLQQLIFDLAVGKVSV